ncbi:MAG: hypothetical protein QW336_01480 [Candidatus Anstonellales archaeon]
MKRLMSKELMSLDIKNAEKGIVLKKVNYAYALNSNNPEPQISISLDDYNNYRFPSTIDGKYVLIVEGFRIGVIEYKNGKPILDRLPRYLILLEWLEDPRASHKDT